MVRLICAIVSPNPPPPPPGLVVELKLTVVEGVLPYFQEDEEEKWILFWSPAMQVPRCKTPVLGDPLQEWPLPAHDFIDAVHRWGSLRREEAVELILEIETALAAPPELKDNVGEDARAPEKHVEDTLREYAPVPEKQVEGAAADKTSLALKRRAHPKPKTKPKASSVTTPPRTSMTSSSATSSGKGAVSSSPLPDDCEDSECEMF
eukprot:g25689.t1